MRALVYHRPWHMTLEDLPVPIPASNEVLVKIESVGICGSDVHGFTGESGRRASGMVMGHEAVGEVKSLGEGVAFPKVGERVAIYNIIGEGAPTSDEGDPSFLDKKVIGVNLAKRGAMAEYLALPAKNALPIPKGVSSEIGVLVEPIAVVLHAFQRLSDKQIVGKRLAIVGSGTIGLSSILVAKESGMESIAILDPILKKLHHAKRFGAIPVFVEKDESPNAITKKAQSALGDKPDLVIDAVGTQASFRQCISLVQSGGNILLIGNLAKKIEMPLQDIVSREISFVGTYGFDRWAFGEAIAMLPRIQNKLASFIEGRCRLEETPSIMTRLAKGELQSLKIVIDISGNV